MRKKIFGQWINDISIKNFSELEIIKNSKGFNFIVTPNLQHIVELNRSPKLRDCYNNACISLCDSRIIALLSRMFGNKILNVVPGSDLTKYFFEKVFRENDSIMVVGSTETEVEFLKKKYSLNNLVHCDPTMGFIKNLDEIEKVINTIEIIKPRYLFLAVGFPRQEQLACLIKSRVFFDCTAFCIGASIDFLTGKQKRSPVIWQKLHLEWFYRFLQEPDRLFRRYFIDSWGIIGLIIKEFKQ